MTHTRLALLGAVLAVASVSRATTLIFDDLADGAFTNQYSGLGVVSDGNSAVWGGIGNGDPGDWGLFGTNGSKFLGNNGDNSYQTTMYLSGVSNLSFDISRSNGSNDGDGWFAQEYNGSAQLIAQQNGTFNQINDWTHVSFADPGVYTLVVFSVGTGFHPYGIDNVVFNAVPEPSSICALGIGAVALLRRKARLQSKG